MKHIHVNEKGWGREIAHCIESEGRCHHEDVAEHQENHYGTRCQIRMHHGTVCCAKLEVGLFLAFVRANKGTNKRIHGSSPVFLALYDDDFNPPYARPPAAWFS